MKITRITGQTKYRGRYSIFIEGTYVFSLSEQALLESGLAPGVELSTAQLTEWKERSNEDKIYGQTLRYVAVRLRSIWEVQMYLEHKGVPPPLVDKILNKLSDIRLLNDEIYARAFIANRRLLRPSSKLKLQQELRAKHISDVIISEALGKDARDEQTALQMLITKKRNLAKFKADPQKFMQYLARQGFSYEYIKTAFRADEM